MIKTIWVEIKNFFRTEKVYFYLAVALLSFYVAVFIVQKTASDRSPIVRQEVHELEDLMDRMPQTTQEIQRRLSSRSGIQRALQVFGFLFAVAFGFGIWLGANDLWRWFSKRPVISDSAKRLEIAWGISEVVKVLILFFTFGIGVSVFFALLGALVFGVLKGSVFLIQTVVLDVAVVFFMISAVRKRGSSVRDLIGFDFGTVSLREIWLGIRTYFVILPFFVALLTALVLLASWLAYHPPPHPLVRIFLREKSFSPWFLGYSLVLACLIGPMVEEIFFRGFLYPAIRKYGGIFWATVITAALFAGVHENLFSFLPIFFLGLVLAHLYEKRHNLISCISLHVLHNAVFITYFFLVKSVLLDYGGG